jgi:hypothetical protein
VPKKAATESGSGSKAGSVLSTETKHEMDVLLSMHGNYQCQREMSLFYSNKTYRVDNGFFL